MVKRQQLSLTVGLVVDDVGSTAVDFSDYSKTSIAVISEWSWFVLSYLGLTRKSRPTVERLIIGNPHGNTP